MKTVCPKCSTEFVTDRSLGLNVIRVPWPDKAHTQAQAVVPWCPSCNWHDTPEPFIMQYPQCEHFARIDSPRRENAEELWRQMVGRVRRGSRADIFEMDVAMDLASGFDAIGLTMMDGGRVVDVKTIRGGSE